MSSIQEVIDTKIFTESNPKIISSDKASVFTNDNIGVVIPSAALSNISLTSVPYVVQEAINQAKLDAKDLALADSILTDIKNRVRYLEDGVYLRTYIDNQLAYLEEIVQQKVSNDTLATIIDTRVAIATEDFVATTTINAINSRIGNSESAISTLSETINTKDLARASQINEIEASLNQSLANYSDAIDLTVDENGNIVANAIESLTTSIDNNTVEINNTKQIAQDANGKWTANAGTLITGPDGKITGIHAKASDSISEVVISADKFKLEGATGTPFSVDGTDIAFNGKVSLFANPQIATKEDLSDLRTIEWINTTNINIEQSGLNNNFTDVKSENSPHKVESKLAFENGCIYTFTLNKKDILGNKLWQRVKISLHDTNTDTDALTLDFLFNPLWEDSFYIPSQVSQSKYFIEGLETQYFNDNPSATTQDYDDYRRYYYDKNGNAKFTQNGSVIDATDAFQIVSFVYTDSSFIVYENGIERFNVPSSSGRAFKIKFEMQYTDVNNGEYGYTADFDVYKWDRFYNNANLISEINELTQNFSNLSSTTASQIANQNNQILAEAQERLNQDALIDGRITAEEQARIDALTDIQTEYKEYIDITTKALADEVITPQEQALINEAWASVQLAKNRFASLESRTTSIEEDILYIDQNLAQNEIDKANLDGKIDTTEEQLINSINAEASARATAIAERINAEALLDGKIDAKEQELINHANTLSDAQANYTDTVRQALIDGEISQAEQNAINEAQLKVNAAKQELNNTIANLTKVEDISWQQEVQDAINNNATTIDGSKIVTNTALVNNLNALGGIQADTVKSYDIKSTNSTFENSIIKNAMIENEAVTNSKIANLSVTNSKIDNLSVSTLKIQDEAVVVPRSTSGSANPLRLIYTPSVTHKAAIFVTADVYENIYGSSSTRVKINGAEIFSSGATGTVTTIRIHTFTAGTTYTIEVLSFTYGSNQNSYSNANIVMLGVKK